MLQPSVCAAARVAEPDPSGPMTRPAAPSHCLPFLWSPRKGDLMTTVTDSSRWAIGAVEVEREDLSRPSPGRGAPLVLTEPLAWRSPFLSAGIISAGRG